MAVDLLLMPAQKVFISYSSKDEMLRKELETHLALLKRDGIIETWTFRNIEAGDDWRSQIDTQLETADIILLLISADFIASDYCWNVEMRRAVERHRDGSARVVPIIVRKCDWSSAPFAAIQALPQGAKPVASWRQRDKAWTTIADAIRHLSTAVHATRAQHASEVRPETPAQRAQRLAATSASRTTRDQIRSNGWDVLHREYEAVFRHIDEMVTEIRNTTPAVRIASGWRPDHSVVRLEPLSPRVYPLTLHCYTTAHRSEVEECGLVARLLFGGMVLPQEHNVVYSDTPEEHANREYRFRLAPTNQWLWLDPIADRLVSSQQLAANLLNELLQLYDEVESGEITLPELS